MESNLMHVTMHFIRKRGKENLLKCTYVLPDGITHTKGFVKDINEAQRYLTLSDGAKPPQPGTKEDIGHYEDLEKPEARNRIDLTKNVMFKLFSFFFLAFRYKFF